MNQGVVWWIKEKQALEKQLAEKEKEITTVKSRNYDLLKQVDELTQKLQRATGQAKKPQRKVKNKQKGKLGDKSTTVTASNTKTTTEDTEQFYKVHTYIQYFFKKILLPDIGNSRKISHTNISCCFKC